MDEFFTLRNAKEAANFGLLGALGSPQIVLELHVQPEFRRVA